jgi:hypothetical protein
MAARLSTAPRVNSGSRSPQSPATPARSRRPCSRRACRSDQQNSADDNLDALAVLSR